MVKNISKDDFCRSFCNYQHTMDCDKEKMICICKNGYKGLYCEYPKDVDSIDKVLEAINRYSIANNDFNYSNPSLVSQIKSGISLIENSGVTIPDSTTDNMEIFMNTTLLTIEEMEYNNKINLLYFAKLFLLINLNNFGNKNRRLDQTDDYISKFLQVSNMLNIEVAAETNITDYKIFEDSLGLISYIWYNVSQTKNIYSMLANYSNSTISLIDFTDCYEQINKSNLNDIIILTSVPNNILSYINPNKSSLGLEIFASSKFNSRKQLFLECKDYYYQIYVPAFLLNYNYTLYSFYEKKGINIYNKSDEAFNDPCYQSFAFDYDLTQKYRKFKVYQNISFNTEYCIFVKINEETNRAEFNCTGNQKSTIYLDGVNNAFDENSTIYNLPFECYKKVNKLKENIALFLYGIILFLLILFTIINWIKPIKSINIPKSNPPNPKNNSENNLENNLENDEQTKNHASANEEEDNYTIKTSEINIVDFEEEKKNEENKEENKEEKNEEKNEEKKEENKEEKNEEKNEENKEEKNEEKNETKKEEKEEKEEEEKEEKLKRYKFFIKKLFENHSLLNLGYFYEFSTKYIHLTSISCIFICNAFLLTEDRIEKRIKDNDRKEFVYQIKNEAKIIIMSLLFSMIVSFILKLIRFGADKKYISKYFVYTIIGIFILGGVGLSGFYCIIWCSMYYNTQIGWLYMGFWGLLFKYILSFIYILAFFKFDLVLELSPF